MSGFGGALELSLNGGPVLVIDSNGGLVFPESLDSGASYDRGVSAQPVAQTCTITGSTGIVGQADVTDVSDVCVGAL